MPAATGTCSVATTAAIGSSIRATGGKTPAPRRAAVSRVRPPRAREGRPALRDSTGQAASEAFAEVVAGGGESGKRTAPKRHVDDRDQPQKQQQRRDEKRDRVGERFFAVHVALGHELSALGSELAHELDVGPEAE